MMKNSLKIFLMLVCVMATLFAVPACNKNNNNPDSTTPPSGETTDPDNNGKLILILSDTNLVLASGETKKLTVRSSLTGMETSGVLWVTDNPDVATVDTSGKVTGIADGEATITVSTLDGLTTAECKVTVASKVTQLIIRKKEIYLEVGKNGFLEYDVVPESMSDTDVIWSSTVPEVATVSENGVITAVANGTTSIMIKHADGAQDSCVVHVITPVTKIEFTDKTTWSLSKGVDLDLGDKYKISPADASNKLVTWESDNTDVAFVSGTGMVKAVGAGRATITAKTSNGLEAYCTIYVSASVTNVIISHSEITMVVDDEVTLGAEVLPKDATNRNVTWTSSDRSIATVSASGIVTARKVTGPTPVIITVRTEDGSLTDTCTVWIINPLKSITFDKTTLDLTIFDSPVKIIPTYDPIDADNLSELRWSSTNPKVATVDANGVVSPVGAGTTEITLSTEDGVHATCTVTVIATAKPVTSVSVEKRFVTLRVGERHIPKVTVLPMDAGDKTYLITSTNESIVKVENNAIIAVAKGTVTLRILSVQNPEVYVDISVKVVELTQDEIDASIVKYNAAITQENNRHLAALATIDNKYSYVTDLKKVLDTDYAGFNESEYKKQKAAIEKNINDYTALKSDAEKAGNTELVNQYTTLISAEQVKLTQLENKWSTYSSQLQIYNEDSAKYKSEKDAENLLNKDNLANINSEYSFILPYLPKT